MLKHITEGTISIDVHVEEKISKELPVFYNPAMKLNRDMTILLLKAVDKKSMQACDLLAGSGIRAIRMLAELPDGMIESITINDASPEATELIEKNIEANKKAISGNKAIIKITTEDGSMALLKSNGFDYIDMDPFGTPDPFLDAAVKRIARDGILAVTATDTSSLAGTFPKVCQRRYWALPDRGPLKHETGLRILARKVQLVATQYEKSLVPIFSYAKEHYMRIFFRCKKSKSSADAIIKQHGMLGKSGPMWLGTLWDKDVVDKMVSLIPNTGYETDARMMQIIQEESKLDVVGFYDIHELCERLKIEVPKFDSICDKITAAGKKVTRTHFSGYGLRSDISEDEIISILRSFKIATAHKKD